MTQIIQEYLDGTERLFESLAVLDINIDGLDQPQSLHPTDWTEIKHSPGVFIKNISLMHPNTFVISVVYGRKGSAQKRHKIYDSLEIHCISGKMLINNLEFKAGDRITIPPDTRYSFEFVEDSYLTVAFTPKNKQNFNTIPLDLNEILHTHPLA